MFIRYNEVYQYFEYDSAGGTGAGPWLPLPTSQIKFPGTSTPSSDPNTLDDYEEGYWTPTIGNLFGSDSGQVYSNQIGLYTKIGRVVQFAFRVDLATKGTMTNPCGFLGLPFLIKGGIYHGASLAWFSGLLTPVSALNLAPSPAAPGVIEVYVAPAGGAGSIIPLPAAYIGDGSTFFGGGTYAADV